MLYGSHFRSLLLSGLFVLSFGLSINHAAGQTAGKDIGPRLADSKTEPAAKPRVAADMVEKSKAPANSKDKHSKSTSVRYLPQKDGVWSVAETDNFSIFFKGDIKAIDKMAQVVEDSRQSAY